MNNESGFLTHLREFATDLFGFKKKQDLADRRLRATQLLVESALQNKGVATPEALQQAAKIDPNFRKMYDEVQGKLNAIEGTVSARDISNEG